MFSIKKKPRLREVFFCLVVERGGIEPLPDRCRTAGATWPRPITKAWLPLAKYSIFVRCTNVQPSAIDFDQLAASMLMSVRRRLRAIESRPLNGAFFMVFQ